MGALLTCTLLGAMLCAAHLHKLEGSLADGQHSQRHGMHPPRLKSDINPNAWRRRLHQQDPETMPDIAINVGPASGPLMTGPGDPITASSRLAPIGPSTSDLPEPTAFYWLADGNLHSLYGAYNGTGYNVTFVQDDQAGYAALTCSEVNDSMVVLDPVPYGTAGPFAINVWVKVTSLNGEQFEYVFSHNATTPNPSSWGPSQVQLYFPQFGHPAYGIVRSIVKDSTDFYQGLSSVTFLDSDGKDFTDFYQDLSSFTVLDSSGKVANLARNFTNAAPIPDLKDGGWHMLTLTSQPDGSLGYRMYVDGALAGQMDDNQTYVGQLRFPPKAIKLPEMEEGRCMRSMVLGMSAGLMPTLQATMPVGSDGISRSVDGGKPLEIDGDIVLCGRSDESAQRGYTGSLAELAIWNTAITAAQVSEIYTAGLGYPPMTSPPQIAPAAGPAAAGSTIEVAAEPPTITPLATGNSVPTATPFPLPYAFFPLADNLLDADPTVGLTSGYGGRAFNAEWEQDIDVGIVIACNKDNDSTIVLDSVPYGASGAWAVNLWFKPGPLYGDNFQYLFSHAQDKFYATGWESNQIRMFYPELDHPAFGVIRSIAKDNTDTETGPSSAVFLDSDNMVGQLIRNYTDQAIALGQVVLQDAKWHMLTLTTLWDGTPGFAMLIDGQLAGVLNGNYTYTDQDGNLLHIDGGAPMNLMGPIVLCGRSTNDTARGYNGRLTHLALFDEAITPLEAYAIYMQGLPSLVTAALAPSKAFPSSSNAVRVYGMTVCYLTQISDSTPVRECPELQACIPLSEVQLAENYGVLQLPGHPASYVGAVGVCTGTMDSGYHLPNATAVPPPMAFFPLTGSPGTYPALATYPVPQYSGYGLYAVTVADDLFGGAIQCDRDLEAEVELDTVPYATSGAFTVNVWFQVNATSGIDMEYIFSHSTFAGATGYTDDPWGANQVEMYFPESGHPAFGIFRAIVKDSTDVDVGAPSQVWVDSDGKVAKNGPRMAGLSDPRGNPADALASAGALLDRQWHMLTVSTQPDHVKGFRLYLDGQLVGQIANTSTYFNDDGVQVLVSGGAPAALSGPIHLCTRADNNNTRYFDGKVAYLGLYDQRLDETEIMLLYQAVQAANATKHLLALGNSETLPQPAPPPSSPEAAGTAPVVGALALPPSAPLLATSGQPCFLPLNFNGTQLNGCVNIHSSRQPVCWVQNVGWQACSAQTSPAAAPSPGASAIAAPIAFFVVPDIKRISNQGNACLLPTVVNEDIVADCMPKFANGTTICYVSNSTMEQCMPGNYESGAALLAQQKAARASSNHHRGVVAGSVIGGLAALAVIITLIVALSKRKNGAGGAGPSSFRKFKDEGPYSYGGAPLKAYPGPPHSAEAGEVEMHSPAGSSEGNGNGNGTGPVQSPGTPSRSFTSNQMLGAGLENLRAASTRSASTTPEDPEVRAVKRAGRLPGIRSSETRIMPTGTSSDSNSPPTERIY